MILTSSQTPMKASQQNWRFVEQLLKETKSNCVDY